MQRDIWKRHSFRGETGSEIERKEKNCKEAGYDGLHFSANTRYNVELTSKAFWLLSGLAGDRGAGVGIMTVISLCDLPDGITKRILCVCVCADLLVRYVFALVQVMVCLLNANKSESSLVSNIRANIFPYASVTGNKPRLKPYKPFSFSLPCWKQKSWISLRGFLPWYGCFFSDYVGFGKL